jgi:hypothetical protein
MNDATAGFSISIYVKILKYQSCDRCDVMIYTNRVLPSSVSFFIDHRVNISIFCILQGVPDVAFSDILLTSCNYPTIFIDVRLAKMATSPNELQILLWTKGPC